jgi:hypothetical protein
MAQRRKRWSELSPDYRHRLERQGITGTSHRTADLRVARGKAPRPAASAAPAEATRLGVAGSATDASREALRAWRDTGDRAAWIPQSRAILSDDAAAALSQLPSPRQWGDVSVTARPGEEPWTMTVEIKGGYDRTVELSGGTDARDVLALLADPGFYDMEDYDAWEAWADQYDYEVGSG